MEIVDFRPEHAEAFMRLNAAWIARHFTLEPKDLDVLQDPQGRIVDKGGRIFIALDGETPVGCVALIPMGGDSFEVAKMTVAEGLRGSGLGRALMARSIEAAVQAGARRLYLETNSALAPALALYRSMGFQDLPEAERPCSEYARCDVWMERALP